MDYLVEDRGDNSDGISCSRFLVAHDMAPPKHHMGRLWGETRFCPVPPSTSSFPPCPHPRPLSTPFWARRLQTTGLLAWYCQSAEVNIQDVGKTYPGGCQRCSLCWRRPGRARSGTARSWAGASPPTWTWSIRSCRRTGWSERQVERWQRRKRQENRSELSSTILVLVLDQSFNIFCRCNVFA